MVKSSEPLNQGRYLRPINHFVPFAKRALEQSLSDRFEEQVKLYPEQIAIKNKGNAVSYRSLNGMANRVAMALLQVCGEERKPVALLLENGDAVIAAILGVLKSGKIYVPLDPSVPRARTEFILRDSQAEVILTNDRHLLLARELGGSKSQLVNLDELEISLPTANVGLTISPDALAYIIYTSGSTGQPKGVVETHRNLLHNVMRNTNVLHICAEDRVSLLRSIGAAGAARDALTALLNGATLCPFSFKQDGLETLAPWLCEEQITIFTSVVTVFRHFVATLQGEEQFDKLRLIYAGGEQVTTKDVELYQKHFSPDCLFVNRLGVSETGTVTYYFIGKETHLIGSNVPVGYPAEDTEILLLDEHGKEVGPDCVGEIAVRSRYLSPGYWRNPELTRSVFLPDPEGGDKRIYRTGDLGRKLPDGCLVHLGWKDFQVNIRGHRIDVAEVEAALLNHPGVKEVAVVGREHWSGEIRLAAAFVPAENAVLSAVDLRKFLQNRIPDYMIPSAFMPLDALPVGPNRKVDRRALPSPDWLPSQQSSKYIAARTELEEFIVAIWEETLSLDVVGIHDSFFDLGGHSLLLGQIVSKLQSAFNVDVPLGDFFEQPTVANLAEIIQTALRVNQGSMASITAVSRPHKLPLSFAQERLWFLDQLEPDTAAYNIPTATLIKGRLNVQAMEKALNEVIKRHEALRTTFTVTNGEPTQVILPALSLTLPVVDLSDLSETESEAEARRLITEHAQRSFDLSEAPLLRAVLLKLSDNKHVFFTIHHLIADAWSIGILFDELSIFYNMYCTGKSSPPRELAVQYVDFAVWQRHWLQGEALKFQASYWKQQLGNNLSVVDLPIDRPRPVRESFRGARQYFVLPESLTDAIKDLSRRESVTLFMTLLAAFKTLLYRYSDREEVIVGSPIAGRNRAEVENLIGLFVNTLVLRTDLSGNPTFRELLRRVRDVCLGAYIHQDLPFEKLVEELQPTRDLSRNPLFQVMFILQNTPVSVIKFTGLTARRLEVDSGTAKFDLTLSLAEHDGKFIGCFEYSTDLFDNSTIERMIGHFRTVLEGILADPDKPISTLPLLTDAEHHRSLVEWNDTAADYPKDKCIHQLFEEQVERAPDAIAIEFEGQRLTYVELNACANQLGNHLTSLGVGPEALVGICIERSIEMVVGLMGILKAGGAYVPLDPSYPEERLRFMLEDSHVSVMLTQKKLVEDRGWRPVLSDAEGMEDGDPRFSIFDPRVKLVYLDRDLPLIGRQSSENPTTQTESPNLAYVIYTSGSTGQPKGVHVSHRSLINCLVSIGERASLTNQDRLLSVTTISFDIAALELFLPLLVGGTVIVASPEETMDGAELSRRVKESSATAMQATPSTWRMLLDAGWRGARDFKIFCGGEALSRELAGRLLECGTLWNLYGPTETTIWSTVYKVESGEGSVPVGRPIANTQIYILDSHRQPVPIGIPGDLYIGGDGLARGYLNRPELTAEKFIPNSFSDNLNAWLYRTGDRAKYLPGGNIEFLGRMDNQIKIRGHRIELGEVEAALVQHPAVQDSVVVADARGSSGEQSLIGYVVPRQQPAPFVAELRDYLKEKLPDYMIPSLFVTLDALPLTPNGKIDRNALLAPDGDRPLLDQGFVEPRTEIEELIAQVWREILKLDRIGIHDNFFELGGHSLLATRVAARLRIGFNVDLALRKLFELPTVAGLAAHIEYLRRSQFGTSIAPIALVKRGQPLPLSFSQSRLWYLQKVDANLSAYNIPVAFRVKGDLDSAALEQALNDMVERHEVFRCHVKEVDGQPRQEILPTLLIVLPVIDLTHLAAEHAETETKRLYDADARQLYDLAKAPLVRATLVKLGVDDHVFILNFHHIIADGSSLVIFYKELAVLYEARRNNKTVSLPRLPVQYADYAAWQHEWLKSSSFDTQLGYWKRQLIGLPEPGLLQTDFDRPAMQTYRGARVDVELSEELTQSLKNLSHQQSVTMFMTLFATFNILLSRISGQEDIVSGSTIAGRNHPETDGLIGFFINALPLRCDLAADPNFVTLLQRVRELCLDASTNQDVPFEKIVEEIKPRREPGHNPIFDILFNVADTSERILTLAGCDVTKLAQVGPGAKFDIVLHAPEVGGKIELAVVYNTALFREARITSLLDQWAALLDQVVSHPELPISQLSLVTDRSRAVLPDPKEALDDSWEGAIQEFLAKQARRSPESLVVVDENQSWTYEEMNHCANRLAHCLIDSGIRPKDLIAIYAHRSSSLVVALFGILKAGASFLILDPAYPPARTIDYLQIAQPKGWLQLEGSGELPDELASRLDNLTMRCRINVPQSKTEILQSLGAYADCDPATVVTSDNPAYVAFTSGSTGEPKGMFCRHGPITHFLPWQKDAFKLSEKDRFAMLSGLAYNHLHRDVFTPLAMGASLYVPPPAIAREPEFLCEWLRANSITVLHLTPALGQLLLTAAGQTLPSVRRIFFGGDVLTRGDVARIRELAPNATIGCFYGATETQRAVGYYEIPQDFPVSDGEAIRPISLGRGIKDVQLLLLNKNGRLAGVGELAELHVRSPHLAEGYLGGEARTKEVFINNPFTNHPNDRLYRTGEMGRYLPDGNVEWAGRNDRRVNVRGFRVELEEIETVLKQHPIVRDAAVLLRELDDGDSDNPKSKIQNLKSDRQLVVYIVSTEEDSQSLSDLLHSYVSARLPDYMVPSHFVILNRLPLNPNGKVEYQALPPVQLTALAGESSDAPQSAVEQTLSVIFARILGREKVGVNEDFFRLGGHSLLAAQVAARIREAFGVALELRAFLASPTVAELARQIELLGGGQTASESGKDEREEFEI